MEIEEAITGRRSIRKFKKNIPDRELILEILDMSRWAPTHCNTQAMNFIIVDDNDIKQKIVDHGGSIVIKNAPLGIVVTYCNISDNVEYSDYIQSAAAVIQNILLCSYSKGLSTCWIAHLPEKEDMRKIFAIPPTQDPIAYILVGYADHEPKPVPRKNPILEISSVNIFSSSAKNDIHEDRIKTRTFFRSVYYSLPTPVKKIMNPFIDRWFVTKFDSEETPHGK